MGMLIHLRHIYNFYCFMPIFYNYHILLATFYMIYWTNLLIQCPVPVPVFCMFFVSQKIHIKRSRNVIKFYEELFWNICDFWELESPQTEAHTAHKTPGRARGPGAWWWVVPSSNVGWSSTSGARKLISEKNVLKSQRNRSYGSPGI